MRKVISVLLESNRRAVANSKARKMDAGWLIESLDYVSPGRVRNAVKRCKVGCRRQSDLIASKEFAVSILGCIC